MIYPESLLLIQILLNRSNIQAGCCIMRRHHFKTFWWHHSHRQRLLKDDRYWTFLLSSAGNFETCKLWQVTEHRAVNSVWHGESVGRLQCWSCPPPTSLLEQSHGSEHGRCSLLPLVSECTFNLPYNNGSLSTPVQNSLWIFWFVIC